MWDFFPLYYESHKSTDIQKEGSRSLLANFDEHENILTNEHKTNECGHVKHTRKHKRLKVERISVKVWTISCSGTSKKNGSFVFVRIYQLQMLFFDGPVISVLWKICVYIQLCVRIGVSFHKLLLVHVHSLVIVKCETHFDWVVIFQVSNFDKLAIFAKPWETANVEQNVDGFLYALNVSHH